MATETNIALLGYGTVGAAVDRLLAASADDIERATGHRLRVVKALVRDPARHPGAPAGLLTTDFAEIAGDASIAVVAEAMGGLEPAGPYVLDLLGRGKHVVTANKQLVARRAPDLFAAAAASGAQLRFEASVCAAIPVIKVLREALADAQARGYAEADPTDDVTGADAAAKMAILATVAFNTRVALADVDHTGIDGIDPIDVTAARELEMVVRLVGAARLVDGAYDVRVEPAFVDAQHPLAKVDGAFNAVMLQGDAIREITLAGPGAGGTETASAIVADITGVLGTTGPQSDPAWQNLPRLPPGESRSPFYFRLFVEDRPGTLAHVADILARHSISVARLVQHQDGSGATLHVVTHEAAAGALADALDELEALPEVRRRSRPIPVVSDRGVAELGWA